MNTIEWKNGRVYMLDQRKLPLEEVIIEHTHYSQVADSISRMVIRGAPAIGVAAAMGTALGMQGLGDGQDPEAHFRKVTEVIGNSRPTAVNLFWALEEMEKVFRSYRDRPELMKKKLIEKALDLKEQDERINRAIGETGHRVIRDGDTVLTHCNAGSLATAGYGTALGVIRSAVASGKRVSVIAGETRPYLQGARLTVWELRRDGIPVTLVTDNMPGYLMSMGKIDCVVVGADRIARNGDVANKIGTYQIAVLADFHQIPFYVAAPLSTVDMNASSGVDIPIEERPPDEVRNCLGKATTFPDIPVFNPAFDVTPFSLISGIITEKGIVDSDPESELKILTGL